ncbi:uncharacterized protein LOC114524264 [Dendronephthya gigantea]|uniref:uncharacterized protein LOC114524264 n=1 Tax=Dendronephthya gigantea TaxID=151771 RepID=UPI0010691851|nr:uncharacterized protein LOC114524264 [Dendronephthya gigantea]
MKMEKCYTIILTLFLAMFNVDCTTTPDPRKPRFESTPENLKPLVGEDIKLEWSFTFRSTSDLSRVQLFRYDPSSKTKNGIASKIVKTGVMAYSPLLPEYVKRHVCKISLNENGFGEASISIQHVQFNRTYEYGVLLELTEDHLPHVEHSVLLKVVDMVLSDEGKKMKVIKSWFGQRLNLKCDVIHHKNTKPLFKWYKKSLTGSTFRELLVPKNRSTLNFESVNQTNFGEYRCEARTKLTSVAQRFKVSKLGYAGPPKNLGHSYYPPTQGYSLFWEQPSEKNGDHATKYILEKWNADQKAWVKRKVITRLQVTISNLQSATKYRVCSANEIGYKETSCSEPVKLPMTKKVTANETGRSNQSWPSLLLVLLMAILSSIRPAI